LPQVGPAAGALFELAASGRPLVADLDQVRFSASGAASGFAAKPIEQPVSVAMKFAPLQRARLCQNN
jgi:hypothetical protein